MRYFLHDTSAFSDDKITLLYMNHGYEGIGLFFTILEKIAFQEKPIPESVLKTQLNIRKKLEKVLFFLYEIELLSVRNGEVFNDNLLKHSEKYQVNKEKNRKRVSEWRANQADKKNVTHYKDVRNTAKDNIIKDNIIKEKGVAKPPTPEIEIYRKFNHLKITVAEKDKLISEGYSINEIDNILDAIENYRKNTNYKNLLFTARKWLVKDRETKGLNGKSKKIDYQIKAEKYKETYLDPDRNKF